MPASSVFFPIIANPPAPIGARASAFIGAAGSPLDGLDRPEYYPGKLDQNYPLRVKSFEWMRLAGVRDFRNYGSDSIVYSWRFVEPERGVFDWRVWDEMVQAAQQEGMTLLASIGNGMPPWANQSDNWRNPPVDLWHDPWEETAWYQYVRAFVERYDGDGVDDMPGLTQPLKYYELWNEPDLRSFWLVTCDAQHPTPEGCPAHQFAGSVHDYVRLTQVGYAAVKAADPSAVVVGPSTAQAAGNPDYSNLYLWNWPDLVDAGGLNAQDVVSFNHYLSGYDWDYDGSERAYVDLMLDHADKSRGGKPVWLTETGWDAPLGDLTQYKATSLVRFAVIAWERPFVDKVFWYSFHGPEVSGAQKSILQSREGPAAIGLEPDPLVEPVFLALDVFNDVLAPFSLPQRPTLVSLTPDSRVYQFQNAQATVWVAWHRPGTGSSVVNINTGGRTVRKIGLLGENLGTFAGGSLTVGPRPIYLTTQLNWNANRGHIAGRVCDGTRPDAWDNGRAGVTVRITGPVSRTTTTDAAGTYAFADLPEGTYTVRLPNAAAVPAQQSVTVDRELPFGRTSFRIGGTSC